MKNFEMKYRIDGTAALQPRFEDAFSQAENIIDFPVPTLSSRGGGCASINPALETGLASQVSGTAEGMRPKHLSLFETEMVQSLRYGSASGQSYDRIKPWQGALAGSLFFAVAIASLFLSL